ncbi:hypothetical protein CYY_008537 [Polysphondylium violaceum]|uniref:Uncharacterized protein n=1 Tax=Polysphondylium violaceum TaxID=133409 RepID=A0A8J4UX78_9MYCE|nr:hypothetical protein CYY_008537 [Polysphondylium violaceum]
MNTLGKLVKLCNPSTGACITNAGKKSLHTNTSVFTSKGRIEARIAALSLVHKTCFNTSKCEERLSEEVGFGMGDPSLNPSPS